MKTYRDHDALCGLALPTADMELRSLVANRLSQCQEYECPDLSSLLHIVVLEEGDTPANWIPNWASPPCTTDGAVWLQTPTTSRPPGMCRKSTPIGSNWCL